MLAARPAASPQVPSTDPAVQYREFFEAHREAFRCCFDALYAPTKPRTDAKVALDVTVDQTGKLKDTEPPKIAREETTASTPEMEACMIDVAKLMVYPAPASNKSMAYRRVFDFRAHR